MDTELSQPMRDWMAGRLAMDGILQTMSQEQLEMFFEAPIATWTPELMALVKDYLPNPREADYGDEMIIMNSSPSTSTLPPNKFTAEEEIWLASLPDELLEQLSDQEALMLTRMDSQEWPQELIQKVEPYIDLEDEELHSANRDA